MNRRLCAWIAPGAVAVGYAAFIAIWFLAPRTLYQDVAQALVRYAEGNQVSVIVMGAATHGLQMQRFVATVPIKVAMEAPCTVILVKQSLPFERLGHTGVESVKDDVPF